MWKLWRPEIKGGIHICGCGHSGTSILTRLIGAHSLIHALPGETGIAKKEKYSFYSTQVQGFEQAAAVNNAIIWAEKTPKHIRNLGFILDCAPSTKVILITRNPKDTVASLKRRYGKLGKSIRRWNSDTAKVLHWSRHPQCITIQYESLIKNTEPTLASVMAFLGFYFEAEQLNFHQEKVDWYEGGARLKSQPCPIPAEAHNDECDQITNQDPQAQSTQPKISALDESLYGVKIDHKNYRNHQINQPLFNNIGSHRKYLTEDEADHVWRSCGKLAIALGYENDSGTPP